jgi:hypothetical protein
MATGIDFSKKFTAPAAGSGNIVANGGNNRDKADLPKAQFWLNLGYSVPVIYNNPDGTSSEATRFTSLPFGLQLDTMSKLAVNKGSEEYVMARTASNQLHDDVMAAVADMKPGEARIIQLEVEVRRVKEDAAVIEPASNPFIRKIQLFAAPIAEPEVLEAQAAQAA